ELDEEWRLTGKSAAGCLHALEQSIESGGSLEVAQARRVGRGDIDGEVARHRAHTLDSGDIIGDAVGAVASCADIDADDSRRTLFQPRQRSLLAVVVEAEAV